MLSWSSSGWWTLAVPTRRAAASQQAGRWRRCAVGIRSGQRQPHRALDVWRVCHAPRSSGPGRAMLVDRQGAGSLEDPNGLGNVVDRSVCNDNEMIGFESRLVLEDAVFGNADAVEAYAERRRASLRLRCDEQPSANAARRTRAPASHLGGHRGHSDGSRDIRTVALSWRSFPAESCTRGHPLYLRDSVAPRVHVERRWPVIIRKRTAITATTRSRWMSPPPIWNAKKPRIHIRTSTTANAQTKFCIISPSSEQLYVRTCSTNLEDSTFRAQARAGCARKGVGRRQVSWPLVPRESSSRGAGSLVPVIAHDSRSTQALRVGRGRLSPAHARTLSPRRERHARTRRARSQVRVLLGTGS